MQVCDFAIPHSRGNNSKGFSNGTFINAVIIQEVVTSRDPGAGSSKETASEYYFSAGGGALVGSIYIYMYRYVGIRIYEENLDLDKDIEIYGCMDTETYRDRYR